MNNKELIEELARKLYGNEKVNKCLIEGKPIPLHTRGQWHKMGYKVKDEAEGHRCKQYYKYENSDKFYTLEPKFYTEEEVVVIP